MRCSGFLLCSGWLSAKCNVGTKRHLPCSRCGLCELHTPPALHCSANRRAQRSSWGTKAARRGIIKQWKTAHRRNRARRWGRVCRGWEGRARQGCVWVNTLGPSRVLGVARWRASAPASRTPRPTECRRHGMVGSSHPRRTAHNSQHERQRGWGCGEKQQGTEDLTTNPTP